MATFTRPPRLSELAGCGSLSAAQDAGCHYQTHFSPLEPNIAAHDRGELSPPRRPPGIRREPWLAAVLAERLNSLRRAL